MRTMLLLAMAIAILFLHPAATTAADDTIPAPALEAPASLDLEPGSEEQPVVPDPLQGAEEKAKYCDPECPEEPSPFTCQDTDSGNRPSVKGTLYFSYYGQVTGVYTDQCTDTTHLTEYWCSSSSNWTTTQYWCLNGCSDGRCL